MSSFDGAEMITFFAPASMCFCALAGTRLELGDSWGAAVHAGVDFRIGTRGALRVDARWMDIDTDVRVNGARIGTANIDPMAYGVSYIHAF